MFVLIKKASHFIQSAPKYECRERRCFLAILLNQASDLYTPDVEFPANARERHYGKKRARAANHGLKKDDAINSLDT